MIETLSLIWFIGLLNVGAMALLFIAEHGGIPPVKYGKFWITYAAIAILWPIALIAAIFYAIWFLFWELYFYFYQP
jgi:hypothetical protein